MESKVEEVDPKASAIFKDKTVFQEDYIPSRILFREDQFRQIGLALKDLEEGARPRNLLGVGDMATGKTLVFKRAYASLPSRSHVYVNCSQAKTQRSILLAIFAGLNSPVKPGFPTDHYWNELKRLLPQRKFLVLTLDEVDNFVDHRDSGFSEFFYSISRETSNVVVTLLTNRLTFESTFLTALDPRARDTFRFDRIEFPDYLLAELTEILADRLRDGLISSANKNGIVGYIAAIAYKDGLRARAMIDLARKAGEIAESNHETSIQDEHVKMALKELDHERDSRILRRLHPVQLDLLSQVLQRKTILAMTLFNEIYPRIAKEHDVGHSYARFWDFLSPLINLNLIDMDKKGHGRGKGVEAVLTIPPHARDIIQRTIDAIKQENDTPTPPRNL